MHKWALVFSIFALSACHSESDNQKILKNQVYENIDSTRTLGAAMDNRQRCSSVNWEDNIDDKGRNTVVYTCLMKGGESERLWTQYIKHYISSHEGSLKNEELRAETYSKQCRQEYHDRDCTPPWIAGLQLPESRKALDDIQTIIHEDISTVKNTYIWSITPNSETPVSLLSMKYEYTFKNGKVSDIYWTGNANNIIRDDIYNDSFNPISSIAQKEISKINCKNYRTPSRCRQRD
ncbi:hypothetical protein MUU49_11800 [Scandinavium goeteborgense]|uniref:hypothetical protein n=1 Tax=Scandinavium goeteborgense TaxID=1851514 RepID=UPI0021662A73|nr:hypothetical protein [Scandinavium goeteborgense]MCS2153248.1 hypothetical protein [Scandinavium goeteborgense]